MSLKLKLAIAVALASPTFSAFGLGLGEIETKSSLNQKFNAEIELLSVTPEELENVHVKLAPREIFEQVGLDRPALLRSLTFSTKQLDDKTSVITVKSDRLVREPYLNFLIEVHWPTGKLVREYTVLLDPPIELTQQTAQPIQTQTPAKVSPTTSSANISRQAPTTTTTRPTTRPVKRASTTSSQQNSQIRGDQYGPVRSGESLSKIAVRVRQDNTTLHQTTVALWKANPDAFIKNNINLLKAGSTLRIPGHDEIIKLNQESAQVGTQKQNNTPPAAASEATPSEENLNKAGTENTHQAETSADNYQLRLVASDPDIDNVIVSDEKLSLLDLKQQLLLINEKVESYRIENNSLRSRVQNLTQQIENNSELSVAAAKSTDQIDIDTETPEGTTNDSVAATPPVDSDKSATVAVISSEEKTVNTMDTVLDKIYWLLGFLALSFAAWLGLSRQNKEHINHTVTQESVEEDIPDDETSETKVELAEPKFKQATEEKPDALSEAEHCIVYGQYELAETLLKKALEESQDKTAIRYKLIEVYYANRDAGALDKVIDSIVKDGDEDIDKQSWERAMELSVELAREKKPDNETSETFDLKGDVDQIDPNWLFDDDDETNSKADGNHDSDSTGNSEGDNLDPPKLKVISGRNK